MEPLRKILIVDDDENFLRGMRFMLKGAYAVLTAKTLDGAINLLENHDVDLILLDIGLENESGLDGIKKIHSKYPSLGVAMLSGSRDVKTVVAAIRTGAVDYLTKPLDTDALAAVVEKAVSMRNTQERCEAWANSQVETNKKATIIYRSAKMQKLMDEANLIRGHLANVLIMGETGTGKELLARYIHEREENERRPFIAVNCAAIPEHLLESELFGHEVGAFTGANRRRIGKFELANDGDIFLDEISTMKLDLQVKLLRVLQEREFSRLGSNLPIKTNFRVISACNQQLEEAVENGSFRMDLYHRLKVIQLIIPPLNERSEDVPLLADYFLEKFAVNGCKKQFSERAMFKLTEYSWPGNVRELANVVQSLVIMTKGEVIDITEFPAWVMNKCQTGDTGTQSAERGIPSPSKQTTSSTLQDYLKYAMRGYIEHVLHANDGDRTKTALALGIGRTTLYMKMKDVGLME